MLKKIVSLGILSCLAAVAVQAENIAVSFTQENHKQPETEEITTNIYIAGEKVKGEVEGEDSYFIFDGDKEVIWLVDTKRKKFTEIDKQLIDDIRSTIEKMEKQLKSMPPTQRAMAENMMKQQMKKHGIATEKDDADWEYKPTSETETISDYSCEKMEVIKDSSKVRDVWTTEWKNIEYRDELETAFDSLFDFVNSLREVLNDDKYASYLNVISMPGDPSVTDKLPGMPISAIQFADDGKKIYTNTLQYIEARDLSESDFRPPDDYQREKPEMPKMSQ